MKAINIFLFLFIIYFTISCSTIYNVQYDYDINVNFARLKTYDWLPIHEEADISSLDTKRIRNSVNSQLKTKGLKITSDNPDFLIVVHVGKEQKLNITNWGYDYGPYGGYWGGYGYGPYGRSWRGYYGPYWGYWGGYWEPGRVSIYEYEEGSLILDFVDAKTKELIWHGSAKAIVGNEKTPEERQKKIYETVQKILEKYPPQQ
ncbi:MAG: DUF4136 domain-containing protein [Desulfobacteraceae bacterium]|nr:DUF4136 domain-containing protein [Desulfobacteraceae bacterium]